MLSIISPAKRLDFERDFRLDDFSVPERLEQSTQLIKKLRTFSAKKIGTLMNISPDLATLNYNRYQEWEPTFSHKNAKQCSLVFRGEVYLGMEAEGFSQKDFEFAQEHLRILSGLHGLLKPLDLIRPYRLEMGSSLKVGRKKNLYEFWGESLTLEINELLKNHKEKVLVNLASNEYFKAVVPSKLDADLLHCEFKEERGDSYKMIGTYAKKARGLMVRYLMQNKVGKKEDIKGFNLEGYSYNKAESKDDIWVFTRAEVAKKR